MPAAGLIFGLPARPDRGLMALDQAPAWLIARGLLRPDALVLAPLQVRDARSRNLNILVDQGDQGGFFIKQADPADPDTARTLRREIQVVRALDGTPLGAHLAPLLWADPALPRLVFRRMVGVSPFDPPDPDHGAALGRALGRLHGLAGPGLPELAGDPPWVLGCGRPGPELLLSLSPAHLEILRLLQRQGPACAALDALRSGWAGGALLHGDIRAANLLITPDNSLLLLDWELACRGDPAWDLACGAAAALWAWVGGVPLRAGREPGELVREAKVPFALARESLGALWVAYGAAAPAPVRAAHAVALIGARLLQLALEASATQERPPNRAIGALQVGVKLLADPAAGADRLGLGDAPCTPT